MYELIKNIVKGLLPKRLILNNESFIRNLIYQFYKGDQYFCTVCNKHLRKFIDLANGEKVCPFCGSLGRNRRLYELIHQEFKNYNLPNVLEFSPSRCLYNALKNEDSIRYTATDFANEFIADKKSDITHMDEKNETYDIIICYHILEHIEKDLIAMGELRRIIKKNGVCYIQTPFKEGEIYEDYRIQSPEEREKHFGQNDHVRIYSVNGLKQRLEDMHWKVEVMVFEALPENPFGYSEKEIVLKAIPSGF